MRVSYNILKELIDIDVNPLDIANKLNLLGFEVDEIIEIGKDIPEKVVVGEIKKISRHPNADKLYVVKVDIGKEILNIVSKVKNYEIGDKVPVALIGAEFNSGLKIERKIIRGIESNGMLCSEKELGISEDYSGIMILPKDLKIGKSLKSIKEFCDTIFEISVTPNRIDCYSILGIAREIAACFDKNLKFKLLKIKENQESIKGKIKVKIEDKRDCLAYLCRVVKNVKISKSPAWLQFRLKNCGIRPINNIVDISNYVMLITGQPIHCFDLDKLDKPVRILIRKSKYSEKILTLDENYRVLDEGILLITNKNYPIAIAGIIGGKETEVSDNTKNILIESALFNQRLIRIGARKLGISTEASLRFERGLSFYHTKLGLEYTTFLIQKLAYGKILKGIEGEDLVEKEKSIKFKKQDLEKILGIELEKKKIKDILEKLNFKVELNEEVFKVIPPLFRKDISIKEDIAEEVGRFLDYNTFPKKQIISKIDLINENEFLALKEKIKDLLVYSGFSEVYNYSFYNANFAKFVDDLENHLELENPLNENQRYLRKSLAPNLIYSISKNLINFEKVKVFEIGKVFIPEFKNELPKEIENLCIGFNFKNNPYEAYKEFKNVFDNIFKLCKIEKVDFESNKNYVVIKIDSTKIGYIKFLNYNDLKIFKIKKGNVIYGELYLKMVFEFSKLKISYKPFSEFPPLKFDISFIFKQDVFYDKIIKEIKQISDLISEITLIDEYISKQGRSLTFEIVFRSFKKTLKDEDIKSVIRQIVKLIVTKFKGQLKGKI